MPTKPACLVLTGSERPCGGRRHQGMQRRLCVDVFVQLLRRLGKGPRNRKPWLAAVSGLRSAVVRSGDDGRLHHCRRQRKSASPKQAGVTRAWAGRSGDAAIGKAKAWSVPTGHDGRRRSRARRAVAKSSPRRPPRGSAQDRSGDRRNGPLAAIATKEWSTRHEMPLAQGINFERRCSRAVRTDDQKEGRPPRRQAGQWTASKIRTWHE